MDEPECLGILSALAQETRLRIVRLLVQAGPAGIAAGALATSVGVSPSNISFHLKDLERSGLVTAHRQSRSIVYVASVEILAELLQFLIQDCCGGRPEICAPALASLTCQPRSKGTCDD